MIFRQRLVGARCSRGLFAGGYAPPAAGPVETAILAGKEVTTPAERPTSGRTQFAAASPGASATPPTKRQQLLGLEKDRSRVWWLSVAIILALSVGVLMFMLPEVFWKPGQASYRGRILFAGYCGLMALIVAHLIRRQLSVASLTKKLISDVQLETLVQLNRELVNKQLELDKAYTQLAESQQNLVRLERLAARGEMSLKMQHEINNPLAVMIGNLALLQQESLPADIAARIGTVEEMARRIQDAMDRLSMDLVPLDILDKTTPQSDS